MDHHTDHADVTRKRSCSPHSSGSYVDEESSFRHRSSIRSLPESIRLLLENVESANEVDQGRDEQHEDADSRDNPDISNKRIILQRFTIYNSLKTMYIVGSNAKETLFRILEIGKDSDNDTNLEIIEDKNYFYTRKDMIELLSGLNETVEGGIYKVTRGYGLIGLIRFTKGYYLSIITKCSQVAILGGHFIYHVDETKLIPLDSRYRRPDKYSDEERLLSIFKYLDLGKTFYFSYSYDITNTLQTNFIRQKRAAEKHQQESRHEENKQDQYAKDKEQPNSTQGARTTTGKKPERPGFDPFNSFEHNERFVWNKLLLEPVLKNQDITLYEWFQTIIHGFVDQANISIYGKKIYITLVARRSHHFAGARFLKRGVNDKGNVANEIETEQIVTDMLVSSFHNPKYGFYSNPRFTSFVQHRGSIPLYWTQDLNKLPKPPIEISLSDPFFQSSAIHFNNLFERYGLPIIMVNLIKTKEKVPRELKLNEHFISCVKYLNQFLPDEHKLQFNSFDMSKHSKKNMDVIEPLQKVAANSIDQIGFFHNGVDMASTKIQKGIIRTNCIDCLDRTNAAQFIICKEALYHQLSSLKLISSSTTLDYDSDLVNILTEIFHDHGDTIAIQYGGSNLVNTMDSYRRINQWSSHTRDMLNSIKRIYSNSFMDLIRQEAINLFLGNYSYDPNKPRLWELQNDYYLHNATLIEDLTTKTSYQHWYNDFFLDGSRFNMTHMYARSRAYGPTGFYTYVEQYPDYNDNWFNECYMPRKFQSFSNLFQFNMNSNSRYFPSIIRNESSTRFDYSPFESRKPAVRISKSGEFSNGNPNVKYLDHIDNDTYGKTMQDIEEDNAANCDSSDCELCESAYRDDKLAETTPSRSLRRPRRGSSNYLKITNPNKIKDYLTTKIEKLGYSAGTHLGKKSPASYESKYGGASLREYDEIYEERNQGSDCQLVVSSDDLAIYQAQSQKLSCAPFKEQQDDDIMISTNNGDRNIYAYYACRLLDNYDASYPFGSNQTKGSLLNQQDVAMYKSYIGLDKGKMTSDFDAEDNYFE